MLFVPNGGNDFAVTASYSASRPGTTTFGSPLTSSAISTANNYGAQYIPVGGALQNDSYGMVINVNNNFVGATFRQLALQFSVDYTGGTNFSTGNVIISGLLGSQAINYQLGGGLWYYFPLFIPSGSRLGVTGRGSTTAAPIPGIAVKFLTSPSNPSMVKRGAFVETIGLTLGAGTVTGVSVTPSTAVNEPNTWTLIGTTTNRLWSWQVGCQHSDTTMTLLNYHVDIGVGTSTTVVEPILTDQFVETSATEQFTTIPVVGGVEKVVPAGSQIYARVHNAGTNENAGSFQVVVYGTGG
jgi:hypothetical protein